MYHKNDIYFGPAKAANAGGVAVSGLEMCQNSMRLLWSREEVEEKLKGIMKDIFDNAQSVRPLRARWTLCLLKQGFLHAMCNQHIAVCVHSSTDGVRCAKPPVTLPGPIAQGTCGGGESA